MKKYIYSLIVTIVSFTLVGNLFANTPNPHYPPTRKRFATPVGFHYKKLNKKHKRTYFWNKVLGRKCHRF